MRRWVLVLVVSACGRFGFDAEGPSTTCGDGVSDPSETCDDGNLAAGDGCSATCAIEVCGNSVVDAGETCDDGNLVVGDGCDDTCRFEMLGIGCSNGALDSLEVCDDGNTTNGDACNPTCNFTNTTFLFVGTVGAPGIADGTGANAQIASNGTVATSAGALWLAQSRTIRRIDLATATVTTIAGDPDAAGAVTDAAIGTNARFEFLAGITTDGVTLWVSDGRFLRTVSIAPPHAVTTVAGNTTTEGFAEGLGLAARFGSAGGLNYLGGLVYVVDRNDAVLASFDPASTAVTLLAGMPGTVVCGPVVDGVGTAARFCSPRYLTSDGTAKLYISDTNGNAIRRFDITSGMLDTFAGNGTCGYADGAAALVHRPRGITTDGTSLYWVEADAHAIRQGILATGAVSTMVGTPPACSLDCTCVSQPDGAYVEGTGQAARWNKPFDITYQFDERSLFVHDGNAVIRRIR